MVIEISFSLCFDFLIFYHKYIEFFHSNLPSFVFRRFGACWCLGIETREVSNHETPKHHSTFPCSQFQELLCCCLGFYTRGIPNYEISKWWSLFTILGVVRCCCLGFCTYGISKSEILKWWSLFKILGASLCWCFSFVREKSRTLKSQSTGSTIFTLFHVLCSVIIIAKIKNTSKG